MINIDDHYQWSISMITTDDRHRWSASTIVIDYRHRLSASTISVDTVCMYNVIQIANTASACSTASPNEHDILTLQNEHDICTCIRHINKALIMKVFFLLWIIYRGDSNTSRRASPSRSDSAPINILLPANNRLYLGSRGGVARNQ